MNLIHKEKSRGLKYFNPGGSHKTAFPVCLLYKSTQSVFFRKPQRADDPLVLFMATKSTMTNKFHSKLEFQVILLNQCDCSVHPWVKPIPLAQILFAGKKLFYVKFTLVGLLLIKGKLL